MSRLVWDQTGQRKYETGVEMGVLYPRSDSGTYPEGVPWNGLIAVNEKPSGAEPTSLYANNNKYMDLYSNEEYGAGIEAYTYPDEFAECDGSAAIADSVEGVFIDQQERKTFGLCYRTILGNDTQNNKYGYKLHLVYGAKAKPTEKNHSTVNDSPEAMTMSWEVSTTPVEVPNKKPTAHVTIDSTKIDATKLAALEEILYGSDDTEARLPLPAEIIQIMTAVAASAETE